MKSILDNYHLMIQKLEENLEDLDADQKSGYEERIYDEPTTERIENLRTFIQQMKVIDVKAVVYNVALEIAMVAMAAGFQNQKNINGDSLENYVAKKLVNLK
jgi:hypothetical protein